MRFSVIALVFALTNTCSGPPDAPEEALRHWVAALVKLSVGMAGANDAGLGFSADAYRFELELEQNGDDWLLIAARWSELGRQAR